MSQTPDFENIPIWSKSEKGETCPGGHGRKIPTYKRLCNTCEELKFRILLKQAFLSGMKLAASIAEKCDCEDGYQCGCREMLPKTILTTPSSLEKEK